MVRTLKVRVRDKHKPILQRMAFEANQVWNAANAETAEWSYVPVPEVGYIRNNISAFDLQKQLKSIRQERGLIIHSTTTQEVIAEHAKARRQFKKDKLRWRVSGGARRSLGWVPFKSGAAKWKNGQVYFAGHYLKVWDSYGLAQYKFRAGDFSEDARGRWYFNIVVQNELNETQGTGQIGIDLGLKTIATCSDGTQLHSQKFYQNEEQRMAKAQRANKKRLVKTIHAKIKNRRMDTLHKFSTDLVKENNFIVIGDVSSAKLAKTKMAKSVLDSGWHMLKTQLKYKAIARSVVFEEVNEAYTTRMCSSCGEIPDSSPKGMDGLGIREWSCSSCGASVDRDINAAKNILRLGHQSLAGGIPRL